MFKSFRWRELFSAGVWMCALWVALFYISLPSVAVVTAALGGLGYGAGCWLNGSRLRTPAVLLLAAGAALVVFFGSSILCDSWGLAAALGAAQAWTLSQCIFWGGLAALMTAALRFVSGRYPSFITAEMVIVVLLLASPLASHRQGAINRPQFLVDPLWAAMIDPVPVLFALGALAAAFLVILQNGRRTRRASVLDLLLLFVLIGGIYSFLPARKLLDVELKDPSGGGSAADKKRKAEEEKRRQAQAAKGEKPSDGLKSEAEDEMPLDQQPDQDKPKQRPVAIVLLQDDYDPPQGGYYFRQTAFSQYNGLRLVADTTGHSDVDLLTDYPSATTHIPSTVPESSPFHKRIHTFTAMVEAHNKPFTLVDGRSAEPEENPNPNQFVRAYGADSLAMSAAYTDLFNLKAGDPAWSADVWKHYTEIPADPRYKKQAEACVAKLPPRYRGSDFARAVACKLYLDQIAIYTTRARHEGYKDPVAHYLFVDHRGYCVHQAHAAVYLFRALGLPARVGAGYYSDARNRGNGSAVLLRSGDAHAWPEVYLKDAGWVILDIAPAKSLDHNEEKPDPDLQRMLGELARKKKGLPKGDPATSWFDLQAIIRFAVWGCLYLLLGSVVVAFVGVYVIKFVRRFEPLWASSARMPVAALRSALDQLSEVGLRRRYGEGRLEFARRIGVEPLEPLTDLHLGVTLGRDGRAASKELLQLREAVHQHIARRFPWWRRLLGFLHPLSWWDSR